MKRKRTLGWIEEATITKNKPKQHDDALLTCTHKSI